MEVKMEGQNTQPEALPTPPKLCPNCAGLDTVTVITKTIGGVTKYYFQCSSCGYRWPS